MLLHEIETQHNRNAVFPTPYLTFAAILTLHIFAFIAQIAEHFHTQFIEKQEASARAWYGGAVGLIGFDGHLNTGLTLRTVRIVDGTAEVRAGV